MHIHFRRSFQDHLESGEQPRQLRLHQCKSNSEYCLIIFAPLCGEYQSSPKPFLQGAHLLWLDITLKFNKKELSGLLSLIQAC